LVITIHVDYDVLNEVDMVVVMVKYSRIEKGELFDELFKGYGILQRNYLL
jgi:hypothetical protein